MQLQLHKRMSMHDALGITKAILTLMYLCCGWVHASPGEPRPAVERPCVKAICAPQQHLAPAAAGQHLVSWGSSLPRCGLQAQSLQHNTGGGVLIAF
jgi:hypothetical protein